MLKLFFFRKTMEYYFSFFVGLLIIFSSIFLQIFRALSYIHRCIGVCHRDIKPQNLLVNPHTHQVKLCDFGSAKVLVRLIKISYLVTRLIWMFLAIIATSWKHRWKENQTSHTFAQGITEHLNLFLEQRSIQQPLMSGLQDVFLLSSCLDR